LSAYERLAEAIEENNGAECEGEPDVFFFEEEGKDQNMRYKTQLAKQICSECPVRLLCLEYALESNEPYGIWGGLTRAERTELRKGGGREIIYRGNIGREEGKRFRFAS